MSGTFCPATMCPLFAADGSPWTGEKNAACPQKQGLEAGCCAWYGKNGCDGAGGAFQQVEEAYRHGGVFQVGPVRQKRDKAAPRSYDCPRIADCQWQQEAGDGLCPPRLALSKGLDPRVVAF